MDNYRSILRTDNGLLVSLTQRHNVAVEILLKTFNISILWINSNFFVSSGIEIVGTLNSRSNCILNR